MAELQTAIAYPEWTEYRKKNGLDPLGMQASSITLYQTLMPGISNVTLRVRYYGYYAWLARCYAKSRGSTDPRDWQRYLRRAEALYALVAQYHGGETGVAGVTWAAKALAEASGGHVEFAADTEPGSPTHYLQQAWGAYGAAYGTQLYTIGILAEAKEHSIAVPSPSIGDSLADAFEESLGPLATVLSEAINAAHVDIATLDRLAPILPSAIGVDGAERDWYERILFAKAGLDRSEDQERRRSLLLVMMLAAHLQRVPTVSELRWLMYSGHGVDDQPIEWGTTGLEQQRQRWWAYHANDLTHVAYETVLKFTLDRLEAHQGGIPADVLVGQVIGEVQGSRLLQDCSWAEFVEQQRRAKPHTEQALCETAMRARRVEAATTPEDVAAALTLLAVVQCRASGAKETVQSQFGRLDPDGFHSLWTELRFLEAHGADAIPAFVSRLILQRILRRHLWVAMRKLRHQGDYTFLIDVDEGRVRLRTKDGPAFTNPRLAPAVTFLKDIHVLGPQGLTARGQEVLAQA